MGLRDRTMADAVPKIATLLTEAYARYRRVLRIDLRNSDGGETVNRELDSARPESLPTHEIDA